MTYFTSKSLLFLTSGALIISIMLVRCGSASRSYQRGDYTQAIEMGVRNLQKRPNDQKNRDLIQSSYNYEVQKHEDEIRILSNSQDELRYDKIAQAYIHLQHLYDCIHQYPAVSEQIHTTDYSSMAFNFSEKASRVHEDFGDRFMDEGIKPSFRKAYYEYNTALGFLPNNSALLSKKREALDKAIVRVLVIPIQANGSYSFASFKLANVQRDIMSMLANHLNRDFVRFYNEGQLKTEYAKPDEILDLSLQRITIGQPFDEVSTRTMEKQVVTREIYGKGDSVQRQYATVKGTISTISRKVISEMDLFINVRDLNGSQLWNDHFTAQHIWKTQYNQFSGDERVLTDSDRSQISAPNSTPNSPNEQTVMQGLTNQLKSDLSYHLNNYYNRY